MMPLLLWLFANGALENPAYVARVWSSEISDPDIERLTRRLSSSSFLERERATREFLALGSRALPNLATVIGQGPVEARNRAIRILLEMGQSEDPNCSRGAIDALKALGCAGDKVVALAASTALSTRIFAASEAIQRAKGVVVKSPDNRATFRQDTAADGAPDTAARELRWIDGVHVVSFSGTNLTNRGLTALASMPSCQELDFSWCRRLDDVDVTQLRHQKTAILSLRGTRVSANGIAKLSTLPSIESLDLSYTALTDTDLRTFLTLPKLRRLSLEAVRLSPSGVSQLTKLDQLDELVFVPAEINGLLNEYDLAMSDVVHGLRHPTKLVLPVGKKTLARLEGIESLRWLDLRPCCLSDEDLAKWRVPPRLERMSLVESQIGDKSIDIMRRWKHLKLLDLRYSKVTEEGAARLRRMLPHCHIESGTIE